MPGTKVFLGGIPTVKASHSYIEGLFTDCGATVHDVKMLPAKGSNANTRCAFVWLPERDTKRAITELHGLQCAGAGVPLVCNIAMDSQGRGCREDGRKDGKEEETFDRRSDWRDAGETSYRYDQFDESHGAGLGDERSGYKRHHERGDRRRDTEWRDSPRARAAGRWNAGRGRSPCEARSLTPLRRTASPGAKKRKAVASGHWDEAAEWKEMEHETRGETPDEKFRRLCSELKCAASQEHFHQAVRIYQQMRQIDARKAAAANASAGETALRERVFELPWRRPQKPDASCRSRSRSRGSAEETQKQRFVGTIRSFHEDRHFGFIRCNELKQDAFLSDKQIGDFHNGDEVTFIVKYNHNGQPQAQCLSSLEY